MGLGFLMQVPSVVDRVPSFISLPYSDNALQLLLQSGMRTARKLPEAGTDPNHHNRLG